jgi:predicted flap endonuclease-1-like 5' DNA nuclease
MQNWEARILAREHEVGDKEADLVRKAATADQLSASLAAVKDLMRRQYQTAEGADDLQAIEGVGPKIASLLHNADIRTFERLSETSVGELSRLLESGGSRFGLADPMTWAEQASLLLNGDYVAFEQLKAELVGGVRRDAALLQPASRDQEPGSDGDVASAGPLFEAAATAGQGGAGAAKDDAGQASDTSTRSDPD